MFEKSLYYHHLVLPQQKYIDIFKLPMKSIITTIGSVLKEESGAFFDLSLTGGGALNFIQRQTDDAHRKWEPVRGRRHVTAK